MKAMVLAAGYGKRLGKITETIPKCLVDVGGYTMLALLLHKLKDSGVAEVVINLHHLGEMIEEYLKKHKNFGLTIHFSREPIILGTGGGIKKAEAFLSSDPCFIVHNSDVYSEVDFDALVKVHQQHNPIATLATIKRETTRPLFFDINGDLIGSRNKEGDVLVRPSATSMPLGFSGIQVLSREIFTVMKKFDGEFSSISVFLEAVRQGKLVRSFSMDDAYWIDMGTPERLAELRKRIEDAS